MLCAALFETFKSKDIFFIIVFIQLLRAFVLKVAFADQEQTGRL
jgi:hypothetical protein